ncbi:MAG: FxsA family protein [Desulfuromonadales bacterium]|nr:FxsA family protein [Desulfuromonadales bacterium]
MLFKLFILFAVVPVLEIYLLIQVGSRLGALPTVALLLLISLLGAWLVRQQGFEIMRRVQAEVAQGRPPAAELLDGALVLVGGTLLLTPGFFTDLLGLFFLLPPSRRLLKQFVRRWLQRRLERGVITIHRL